MRRPTDLSKVAPETSESSSLVEKSLPNGDLYTGAFSLNAPHGKGKYLWADGCMYEGEWRRGKAQGKGKFSWPSGATYEGEFRSGRMEGSGTFTGSEGDTYRGQWLADRKHGHGTKKYSNGDCYDGCWRKNLQDGQGRYVWRNGNQYIGEWRNGVISGRGVLVWSNGNRYDGQWENGFPRGSGVFSWPDGSYYIGSWGKGESKSLNGTFYPAAVSITGGLRKSSSSSLVDGLPKICIWEADGEAGDITCDIIDTLEASMMCRVRSSPMVDRGLGSYFGSLRERSSDSPYCLLMVEGKKPGMTISKGHKNYDLVLNLQLGIRYSVGRPGLAELKEIRSSDFDPKEKFWTRFPTEGSKCTPPHQSVEFRWKDYCPNVFRHLRKLFAIDPADYMLAICANDALRELSSPGKSGSFFYLTQDDRFMIKTVKKSEVKVLIRMLPSYYQHVRRYENTLLTRFYGVHCVKPIGGPKVRFIIMGNLFCSEHRIHRRFDLKGSSHGRTTDKVEGEIDETTTLKDLDLNFIFRLHESCHMELLEQIKRDCEFLEAERIMDYSLLVGIHFRDSNSTSKMGIPPHIASPRFCGKNESFHGGGSWSDVPFSELSCQDMVACINDQKPTIRLGTNMCARAEHVAKFDFMPFLLTGAGLSTPTRSGELYDVILYAGIIDILQDYDITKKLEHAYKSLQVDPNSISAVDPKLYSRRFQDFICRIFVEDD